MGHPHKVLPAAEPLEATIAAAGAIASAAPIAVRQAKKALFVADEVDFAAAIAAFAEKREPVFRGE
jgi:enoyl-CoA hydratase/carnithine racemase